MVFGKAASVKCRQTAHLSRDTKSWEANLHYYEAELIFASKMHAFKLFRVTQSKWNRSALF